MAHIKEIDCPEMYFTSPAGKHGTERDGPGPI